MVLGAKTSDIVVSKNGDRGDNSKVTCGAVDEGGVKALLVNGVDDVDCVNFVSCGCIDRRGKELACPPPLPQPRIGCILT